MDHHTSYPLQHLNHEEVRECYIATLIRGAAFALIGVFEPAYLITLGFSIRTALVFLAIRLLMVILIVPRVAKLTHSIGIKHSVIAAPFVGILYLGLLSLLAQYPRPTMLIAVALAGAVSSLLYWVPMNSHFAKHSDHKHVGEQASYLHVTSNLASVFGPLLGGLIIIYFGFPILFAIGSALLLLCVAPLFMTKDYLLPIKHEWEHFASKKNAKYSLAFFVQGIYAMTASVLFPFYVYLQSNSFEKTGIAAALIGLGMVLSALAIGKASDKFGKHSTLKIAAIVSAFVWLLALFSSSIQLYILSVLLGITSMAMNIEIYAIFCEKLRPKNCVGYVVLREVWLAAGCAAIVLLMAIFLSVGFELAFVASALASMFFVAYRF